MRNSEIEDWNELVQEAMDEMPLDKEDYKVLAILGLIPIGMVMTILGIFTPHDSMFYWEYMLPIGLPLWFLSTITVSSNLTFPPTRDIVKTIDVNK
jgi:hypothetical protein